MHAQIVESKYPSDASGDEHSDNTRVKILVRSERDPHVVWTQEKKGPFRGGLLPLLDFELAVVAELIFAVFAVVCLFAFVVTVGMSCCCTKKEDQEEI